MDFREPKGLAAALVELGCAFGLNDQEIEDAFEGEGRGGPTGERALGFDHNYVLRDFKPGVNR